MASKTSTYPDVSHTPIPSTVITSSTSWYLYSCCRCNRTRIRSYEKCPACKHQGFCCVHCTYEPRPERWSSDTGGLVYADVEVEIDAVNDDKQRQDEKKKDNAKNDWALENKKWLEETKNWAPRQASGWKEVRKEKKGAKSSRSWTGCCAILTYIVLFVVMTSWLDAQYLAYQMRPTKAQIELDREHQRGVERFIFDRESKQEQKRLRQFMAESLNYEDPFHW